MVKKSKTLLRERRGGMCNDSQKRGSLMTYGFKKNLTKKITCMSPSQNAKQADSRVFQ